MVGVSDIVLTIGVFRNKVTLRVAPWVESSIAVEDAIENRGLYCVFVSCLFSRSFGHYSTTIARLSPPSSLERGG